MVAVLNIIICIPQSQQSFSGVIRSSLVPCSIIFKSPLRNHFDRTTGLKACTNVSHGRVLCRIQRIHYYLVVPQQLTSEGPAVDTV